MHSKEYLKSEYPDLKSLRQYAGNVFTKCCEMTVSKGELVPKNFSKYTSSKFNDLTYSELLNIIYKYQKEYSQQQSLKKSKTGIHTINDYKSEPFRIEHVFQGDSSDNLIVIIVVILVILIIFFAVIKYLIK